MTNRTLYAFEELAGRYLIPALKRELCKELMTRGITQQDISKILIVTPAAVSQYLKNKRAQKVDFPQEILLYIKKKVDIIFNSWEESNAVQHRLVFRQQLTDLVEKSRSSKVLCSLHKELEPEIVVTDCCKICLRKKYI